MDASGKQSILKGRTAGRQAKCTPGVERAGRASFQQAHRPQSGIDCLRRLPQHNSTMTAVDYDKPRRSSRMFMRMRVVASGKNAEGRRFREACETIVINAHGGLLYLDQPLEVGAIIVLANSFTQEEQECRVVFLSD